MPPWDPKSGELRVLVEQPEGLADARGVSEEDLELPARQLDGRFPGSAPQPANAQCDAHSYRDSGQQFGCHCLAGFARLAGMVVFSMTFFCPKK
jgi:hypothetical protein